MKWLFLSYVCFCLAFGAMAQVNPLLDSLNKNLSLARSEDQKIFALGDLASYYRVSNGALSDSLARESIEIAELSRDREKMIRAYLLDGQRRLNMAAAVGSLTKARKDYEQVARIARENGLNEGLGYAEIGLARYNRAIGDYVQALNHNQQAISISSGTHDDSLGILAYNSLAVTYRYRNEKLLALRAYLQALDIAEEAGRADLLRTSYYNISDFYSLIEDYDKAIDYIMKSTALDQKDRLVYNLLDDYEKTGAYFTARSQMDLAASMYEKAMKLADSIHYDEAKQTILLGIANMYLNGNEIQRGMDYLNTHPEVRAYFTKAGLSHYLDEGYAAMYSQLGRFDSAAFYFAKSGPLIEKDGLPARKLQYYREYGDYLQQRGQYREAIQYFQKSREMGMTMQDLEVLQNSAKALDTLYGKIGDFKTAYFFEQQYNVYKDSIQSLAKESDLLKLEVDNDNRRRERLAREEEENTRRRHNIQYMGFTAGLAGLFVILVMLGFFQVSPRTIRALGFFSFIFLFEFVILLADHIIHEATHGEPWKVLIIKVLLAAVLLPLHHWLEHKVIHYLSSRKKFAKPAAQVTPAEVG